MDKGILSIKIMLLGKEECKRAFEVFREILIYFYGFFTIRGQKIV